jgi:hypothetical protein
VSPDDDIVVAGIFQGALDTGNGLQKVGAPSLFLTTLDPSGAPFWSKAFSAKQGLAGQAAPHIAVDALGDILLVAPIEGTVDFGAGPLVSAGETDVAVVKFDSKGHVRWSKRFGALGYDIPSAVAVDSHGSIAIVGVFEKAIDFGAGPIVGSGADTPFLAKLTLDGQPLWALSFQGTGSVTLNSVAIGDDDNVIAGGAFTGTFPFGSIAEAAIGQSDGFVAKFDSTGAPDWVARLAGAGCLANVTSVAARPSGEIAAAGTFVGTIDAGGGLTSDGPVSGFVSNLGADGSVRWVQRTGDPGVFAKVAGIAMGGDGSTFLGAELSTGILLAKYTSNGSLAWSRASKGPAGLAPAVLGGIDVDSANDIIVAGTLSGSIDLGFGLLTAKGAEDVLVAKIHP